MPELTTTIVRRFTAATARTSSSCRPGSASVARSKPSLSVIAAEPTTTIAASALAAAATASASSWSPSASRRDAEAAAPSGPSPSAAGLNSSPMRHLLAGLQSSTWPGPRRAGSWPRPGRPGPWSAASATTSPSTVMVSRPTPAAPSRCGPLASGRKRWPARSARSRPSRCPAGHRPTRPARSTRGARCRSTLPSAAMNSSRSPGSPVTGSRSEPAGGSGTITQVWQPAAAVTSACPASAAGQRARRRGHAGRDHARAAAALDGRLERARPEQRRGCGSRPARAAAPPARCAAARKTRAVARRTQTRVDQAGTAPRRPGRAVPAPPVVQRADPPGQPEQPDDLVVEHSSGWTAPSATAWASRLAPGPVRAGHGQVERGQRGRRGAAGGVPVRGDHAVEAPLALEHVLEQRSRARSCGAPLTMLYAAMTSMRRGLADAGLERHQVQLAEHLLGDPGVIAPALGLRVVADVVLDRGRDAGALQPAHVRRWRSAAVSTGSSEKHSKPRPPSGVRIRLMVGAQQDVDALAAGLGAEGRGQLADQARVPGGAERADGQGRLVDGLRSSLMTPRTRPARPT